LPPPLEVRLSCRRKNDKAAFIRSASFALKFFYNIFRRRKSLRLGKKFLPTLKGDVDRFETFGQFLRPTHGDQFHRPISSTNFIDQFHRPISSTNIFDQFLRPISSTNFFDQFMATNFFDQLMATNLIDQLIAT
jgi:hypothetical protein